MERKREIIIQKAEEGKILIDWISKRYTYHTMEKWAEYIKAGRIKIDDNTIKPETVLKKEMKVVYYPEPIVEPPINRNIKTIYEDKDLLVINKPADLPCHPGGIYFKNTLWYILKQKYEYFSLVNRLDRETSGVMLVAKTKESAKFYFNNMMDRNIDKEYLVVVYGHLDKKINASGWLVKDKESVIRKKRKFILDPDANPKNSCKEKEYCKSLFTPIKSSKDFTLVRCEIFTGRTHQIRATINSLGFPVVGDKIYGLDDSYFFKFINDTLTENEKKKMVIENQALHSYITTIPMLNGDKKILVADPPENWPIKL